MQVTVTPVRPRSAPRAVQGGQRGLEGFRMSEPSHPLLRIIVSAFFGVQSSRRWSSLWRGPRVPLLMNVLKQQRLGPGSYQSPRSELVQYANGERDTWGDMLALVSLCSLNGAWAQQVFGLCLNVIISTSTQADVCWTHFACAYSAWSSTSSNTRNSRL